MKAEARIECLRAGGVNVDEFLQEAETLSVQDMPRSASSLSVRTDASGAAVNTIFQFLNLTCFKIMQNFSDSRDSQKFIHTQV